MPADPHTSLDAELRERLDMTAATMTVDSAADLPVARTAGTRRRRNRYLGGGLLSLLLVCVAGAGVWRLTSDLSDQTVVADVATGLGDASTSDQVGPLGDEGNGGIDDQTPLPWRVIARAPFAVVMGDEPVPNIPVFRWDGSRVVIVGGGENRAVSAAWSPDDDEWMMQDEPPLRDLSNPKSITIDDGIIVWGPTRSCAVDANCGPRDLQPVMLPSGKVGALAPLAPRRDAEVVWIADGRRLVVWGGFAVDSNSSSGGADGLSDGAIYDLGTDSWEMIPANPFGASGSAVMGWWDGSLVLGQQAKGSDVGMFRWHRYSAENGWTDETEPGLALVGSGLPQLVRGPQPDVMYAQIRNRLLVVGAAVPLLSRTHSGVAIDLETDTWTPLADMPGGSKLLKETEDLNTIVVGDKLVTLLASDGVVATLVVYDSVADGWSRAPLPDGLYKARQVASAGGSDVLVLDSKTGEGAVIDVGMIPTGHGADLPVGAPTPIAVEPPEVPSEPMEEPAVGVEGDAMDDEDAGPQRPSPPSTTLGPSQGGYPTLAEFLESLPPGEFPASGLTPEEFERDVVAAGRLDDYRRFDDGQVDLGAEVPFVIDPQPNDQRYGPVVTGADVVIGGLLVVGVRVTGDRTCWGITQPTLRIDRAKQEVRLGLEQHRRPEAEFCHTAPGTSQYRLTVYVPGIRADATVLDADGMPLVDPSKIVGYDDANQLIERGPDGIPVRAPSRERLQTVTLDLGLG